MKTLDCGHMPSEHSDITTGYGTTADGKTFCYDCCAEMDRQTMKETGRITLYLTCPFITARRDEAYQVFVDGTVTNWPGSLKMPCRVKRNRRGHNWGLTRYDAWFRFDGYIWHGVQYGENTQLIHCKRTKEKG